jgi:hypothetical protein
LYSSLHRQGHLRMLKYKFQNTFEPEIWTRSLLLLVQCSQLSVCICRFLYWRLHDKHTKMYDSKLLGLWSSKKNNLNLGLISTNFTFLSLFTGNKALLFECSHHKIISVHTYFKLKTNTKRLILELATLYSFFMV